VKRILLIVVTLVISLVLTSSPAAAKPKLDSVTSDGEYNYEAFSTVNGCYYDLSTVWVDFTGVCYWTCTEYEDGSISQSSIINGEADIYQYIKDEDNNRILVLLEENIPFDVSEEFLDLTGDKTYKTEDGYYTITVRWDEMDEYYYHRVIEDRFEEERNLKKNGKWDWWYKAGKCHDRVSSNKF